jgi:hypothetical protein
MLELVKWDKFHGKYHIALQWPSLGLYLHSSDVIVHIDDNIIIGVPHNHFVGVGGLDAGPNGPTQPKSGIGSNCAGHVEDLLWDPYAPSGPING